MKSRWWVTMAVVLFFPIQGCGDSPVSTAAVSRPSFDTPVFEPVDLFMAVDWAWDRCRETHDPVCMGYAERIGITQVGSTSDCWYVDAHYVCGTSSGSSMTVAMRDFDGARTLHMVGRTVIHEAVHLESGESDEGWVNSEVDRCLGGVS